MSNEERLIRVSMKVAEEENMKPIKDSRVVSTYRAKEDLKILKSSTKKPQKQR